MPSACFLRVVVGGLIYWELHHRNPVVNFRPLAERNFAACCIIIFCAYLALYAASTSLPGLLQSLFGYDALSAGLVMSPAGGAFFLQYTADPVAAQQFAWQELENLRQQQAS